MKVAFLHSDKPRERLLADAFLTGAARHGHTTYSIPLGQDDPVNDDYDIAAMVGVKSNERFYAHRHEGRKVMMLDKGYSRHHRPGGRVWEYWRIAIDAHQPTSRIATLNCPTDRREGMGWEAKPWRKDGASIIFAGSSDKYHAFHRLPDPNRYARSVVTAMLKRSQRRMIYRPKPSWHGAYPLKRARFSKQPESLSTLLESAWALVTHGSNASFDAIMAGVPCVILGDAVAKPISSTSLDEIESPRMASEKVVRWWLANLAYWQWTEAEFASGEAWDFLKENLHG